MTTETPGERPQATPFAATPGMPPVVSGLADLAAVVALLPLLGDDNVSFLEQTLSYVLTILPSGVLVYGLLALLDTRLRTPWLLLVGAAAGVGGTLAAYLGGRPEALEAPAVLPLMLLFLADALRMAAAVSLALALARQVTSPGAALLVAASASDLFSVFAGPTKALVQ